MFSTSKGLFVRRRRVEYEEAQKNCSVTKLHSSSYYRQELHTDILLKSLIESRTDSQ